MDTGKCGQRACDEPTQPPRLEALARALGAAASRRRVLGAALAALLVPRLPVAGAAATQEETCPGGACPCPCSDPPCFVPAPLQEQGGGQFNGPTGVAAATDGTVYVADRGNDRVQYFDAAGTYLGQWGTPGNDEGEFIDASAVAVAPDGTVYVVDSHVNHRVQIFDAAGTYLGRWGSFGSGEGQFTQASGVAVAPDGETVYVSDAQAGRIQAFCVVPSAAGEPARATPVAGSPVVSGAATPVTAGSG